MCNGIRWCKEAKVDKLFGIWYTTDMSLEKAVWYGKEHRKPYYKKAKNFDRTCRNGGSCDYCQMNRHYRRVCEELFARDELAYAGILYRTRLRIQSRRLRWINMANYEAN